jgi:hypothetical protein
MRWCGGCAACAICKPKDQRVKERSERDAVCRDFWTRLWLICEKHKHMLSPMCDVTSVSQLVSTREMGTKHAASVAAGFNMNR